MTISIQSSSPAVFQCGGQGTLFLWYINEDIVVSSTRPPYEAKGFTFMQQIYSNNTRVNTFTIPATVENNNTLLRCHATGTPGPATSENARLKIAGIFGNYIHSFNSISAWLHAAQPPHFKLIWLEFEGCGTNLVADCEEGIKAVSGVVYVSPLSWCY